MSTAWILVHFLPTAGFLLAVVLLAHVIRERRSPASMLAWLLGIIFVPYLGVPLYIILGGRKVRRKIESKGMLPETSWASPRGEEDSKAFIAGNRHGAFPPTSGNRATLLGDGRRAYREILGLIGSARRYIHVATFVLGRDETGRAIVTALAERAASGVKVRLLLDALGSVRITRGFLRPLLSSGGEVAFFMPMLHIPFRGRANLRNHRKMIVADGAAAVVGGMNLAREYMGGSGTGGHWRDLSLLLEGPAVAGFEAVFRSDWRLAAGEEIPAAQPAAGRIERNQRGSTQVIAGGPDVEGDPLRDAILAAIFKSVSRVWILTPYFAPDELLVGALCLAARRGVDVKLIIPQRSNHRLADLARESYLTQVQEAGASVMLYQKGMMHAKAVLVDEDIAVLGSANMDMRSLLLNYEIALGLRSQELVTEIGSWASSLESECAIRPQPGSSRIGILEGAARILAPLL